MAHIASLEEWRSARADNDDVRRCSCGGEWFRLEGHDGGLPAVTMNTDGAITGYAAGALVCNDCGRTQQ